MDLFVDSFDFLNDPYQLYIIIALSVLSAIFMVWLEKPKDKPNPMQGNGFMKGYKRPETPPKTMEQLLQLEKRDESLPLVSLSELSTHTGGDQTAWVCLKGVIYDVSANDVYDSKGGYNLFAGRDASVALATMLFDKINERKWRKCTKEQLECLDEWTMYYKDRYRVAGYLKEEYKVKK